MGHIEKNRNRKNVSKMHLGSKFLVQNFAKSAQIPYHICKKTKLVLTNGKKGRRTCDYYYTVGKGNEDYRDEIFRAKIDLGDTTWTYYSVNNPA